MKKIIFFEKINYFNLIILIFFKIFFKNFYYHITNDNLKKNSFKRFFNKINLTEVGFKDLDNTYHNRGFEIGQRLEENLFNYINKNFLFNSFIKLYDVNIEKFKLSLIGELSAIRDPGRIISLIDKNFSLTNNIVYFFPSNINSYLLLKKYDKNLKVISIFIFFNIISLFLKKFLRFFKKKLNKKKTINKKNTNLKSENFNLENFEIAFFPHHSLKYGKAYAKNHIFSENKNSKTYKSKILTILKSPVDKFSLKYFNFYNIPKINIQDLGFKVDIKKIFFLFKNLKFIQKFSFFKLILSYFIFINIIQIEKNINALKKLKKLKLIYCDFDIIFPKNILLACDILKIKTLSIQERYLANNLMVPLFYNYYLVTGNNYEKMFKNSGYVVDKYFKTGILRNLSNLNYKKVNLKKEVIRLKKITKKKVLCLGLYVRDNYFTCVEGENGTSIKNNITFFSEIINLAENFKNLHFIIRNKIDNQIDLLPEEIFDKIKKIENIEFNNITNNINIYELLGLSSFVIGRYSSVIEESLSEGIEAIIYDECNFFESISKYHPNSKILTVKNRKDLMKYVNNFNEGKDNYDDDFKKEIKNSFSGNFENMNSKDKIQKIINELI